MATRIYGVSQGEQSVTEGVGSAVSSKNIELTVDFGAASPPNKSEVLEAIEQFKLHIVKGKWPPA